MGNLFETIERAEFGGDGFDDAVKRIAVIEEKLGLSHRSEYVRFGLEADLLDEHVTQP